MKQGWGRLWRTNKSLLSDRFDVISVGYSVFTDGRGGWKNCLYGTIWKSNGLLADAIIEAANESSWAHLCNGRLNRIESG